MRPENRERLVPGDVVLAAHPGSGTSWVATFLAHLGVFYAAGDDERLAAAGEPRTEGWFEDAGHRPPALPGAEPVAAGGAVPLRDQRRHLPELRDLSARPAGPREPLRVVHTGAAATSWVPAQRVVLLVRDGRDAVLSLYHNLVSFSGLEASLLDFLEGGGGAWPAPAMSWGFACLSWTGAVPAERLHVLKFEDCRADPVAELGALLAFLEVERTRAELEHAIEESSYDRMREKEEREIEAHGDEIGRGRVMRRGRIGEWREVYTAEMLATFEGLPRRALDRFGYPWQPR